MLINLFILYFFGKDFLFIWFYFINFKLRIEIKFSVLINLFILYFFWKRLLILIDFTLSISNFCKWSKKNEMVFDASIEFIGHIIGWCILSGKKKRVYMISEVHNLITSMEIMRVIYNDKMKPQRKTSSVSKHENNTLHYIRPTSFIFWIRHWLQI